MGNVYESGTAKIGLWVKKPQYTCGPNAQEFQFKLIPVKAAEIQFRSAAFLSWRLNIVTCEGNSVSKFWCEDITMFLKSSRADMAWERSSWEVYAKSLILLPVKNSLTPYRVNEKDTNLGNDDLLQPATSINGPTEIFSSQEITLSVQGGNLSKGATWNWYKDDCSTGVPFARGEAVTVKPQTTTKYFVRGENGSKKTTCTEIKVVVDNNSDAPTGIVSGDNEIFCEGSSVGKKLSVSGGKLGYKAQWVWYENSIRPVNQRFTGPSITVSPSKTTTYFVRAESDSMITNAAEYTVIVQKKSIAPTSINIIPEGPVYRGDLIKLQLKNGVLGEGSVWKWQKTSAGNIKTNMGQGTQISDQPYESGVYRVFASGICEVDPIPELSLKVDVNSRSYAPAIPDEVKQPEQPSKPSKTSENASAVIPKKKYTFFNAGIITDGSGFDPNRISNFLITVGSRSFYLKATVAVPSLYGNTADDISSPSFEYDGTRITNYPSASGTYYKLNEKIYSNLRTYNLGFFTGKKGFKLYFGAGYGFYDLLWGVDTYNYGSNTLNASKWASYTSKSLSGPSAETGIFLKLGPVNIMSGINGVYSIEKKEQYISGQLGLGLSF